MALVKRDRAASTHLDPVERLFGDLPTWMRWPTRVWPTEDFVRVDEYREDSTLVVRAEMPGIDPDKDVEVTLSDEVLHIGAERREGEEGRGQGLLPPGTALRLVQPGPSPPSRRQGVRCEGQLQGRNPGDPGFIAEGRTGKGPSQGSGHQSHLTFSDVRGRPVTSS